MNVFNRHTGLFAAAVLASGTALSAATDRGSIKTGQALVALPQQKAPARNELDQLISSLSGVYDAYAAADPAQAQVKLKEARSSWKKLSPAVWAREAREIQLWFDSLETELKGGAPAEEVTSTIYEILEELDDMAGVWR